MTTSSSIRLAFPVGCIIETTDAMYLLKGQHTRTGRIAGYCAGSDSDTCVRVVWDGWKLKSSMAVQSSRIHRLEETI